MRAHKFSDRSDDTNDVKNAGTVGAARDFAPAAAPRDESGRPVAPIHKDDRPRSLDTSIDLARKDSLTGCILISRPQTSITLQDNDEDEIHSPMFFVADEIEVDGQQALVMVVINAPLGEPRRLGDIRPDAMDRFKDKTLFYGGNFGHKNPDGSLKFQMIVPTHHYWLSLMPEHPYHKKANKPDYMVIDSPQMQSMIVKHGWAYNFIVTSGFCILPKDEIGQLLAQSDMYALKNASPETVFCDHSGGKYLRGFRDLGLTAHEIPQTIKWAQDIRRQTMRPH